MISRDWSTATIGEVIEGLGPHRVETLELSDDPANAAIFDSQWYAGPGADPDLTRLYWRVADLYRAGWYEARSSTPGAARCLSLQSAVGRLARWRMLDADRVETLQTSPTTWEVSACPGYVIGWVVWTGEVAP